MKKFITLAALGFLTSAYAQSSYMKDKAFYVFSDGYVAKVEADGKVSWKTSPIKQVGDLWVFKNSILFTTFNGVKEITRDTNTERVCYQPPEKPEIYATQKLDNGNYLVAECTAARLLEVKPDNTIVKEIKLGKAPAGHGFMRGVRKTPQGTYLVGHMGGKLKEYTDKGEVVWFFNDPAMGSIYQAVRLKNGNTLASFGENDKAAVAEIAPDKTIVWSVKNADLLGQGQPEPHPMKFCTGFFLLPNGNLLLTSWIGHGHLGKSPHLFEITRDKKIVWSYADHTAFKTICSVHPLNEKGEPLDPAGVH